MSRDAKYALGLFLVSIGWFLIGFAGGISKGRALERAEIPARMSVGFVGASAWQWDGERWRPLSDPKPLPSSLPPHNCGAGE